jgi:signal transduction histidine kinase/DNA-binding response OmpR family regulator
MSKILSDVDTDTAILLDNLDIGIVRLDSLGKCIYSNKFVLATLGITSIDNFSQASCSHIHKDDIEKENELNEDFLRKHRQSESTSRLFSEIHKEHRWVNTKRILVNSTGQKECFLYTIQDVHMTKILELQLRKETQRAEDAYNHKTTFLANMSHEIRTPLNGIIGMLTLLEDTPLSNDQQDYIGMVKECSFNLMTIINDILDYSKLEVGKITLDARSMCLRDCIESANDIIMSKIHEKKLEYTYNIHPDVPDMIIGDSNRIKQILLNLLSNSIKFTDKGTIFLNLEILKAEDVVLLRQLYTNSDDNVVNDTGSIFVKFEITDTGCGIDISDKDKLFKSFSQVDNRITNKIYQGTGLGLAISKELVELMNGFIWLEWSEVHKGSRFSFVIGTSLSTEDRVARKESCDEILRGANVLIVDDNMYNRISLAGMITKWGMKPFTFSTSEEALYFTKVTPFDLGLIDICMPKIDGISFAMKLRDQSEMDNKNFPLIALSSLGDNVSTVSKYFKTHQVKPLKEQKLKQACIDSLRNYKKVQRKVQQEPFVLPEEKLDTYLVKNNLVTIKDNVRILLAEDVHINQRVILSFLNKLGYKSADVVDNGQKCLDSVFSNTFDLILLDIRMPILSGEAVLKRLQAHFKQNDRSDRKPYVVAVTAYCLREDREKYLSLGFDDYIPKPITLTELSRCMNTFLQHLLRE